MKLRLVVARVGDMDLARWWNTQGQMGRLGTSVLQRGFPRTHYFAQARSVFAVASYRCREVYDAPRAVTLWHLPSEIEDEFSQQWEGWLDNATNWAEFFGELESCGDDLHAELIRFDLVDDSHLDRLRTLRHRVEQRAVQLPGAFAPIDDAVTMLAVGFARGEIANLAVPYQHWDGDR